MNNPTFKEKEIIEEVKKDLPIGRFEEWINKKQYYKIYDFISDKTIKLCGEEFEKERQRIITAGNNQTESCIERAYQEAEQQQQKQMEKLKKELLQSSKLRLKQVEELKKNLRLYEMKIVSNEKSMILREHEKNMLIDEMFEVKKG